MTDTGYSEHFDAAADLIEPHTEDQSALIDAITDRTYEDMETTINLFEVGLEKFEIDTSYVDLPTRWLCNEFKLHGYVVSNVKDRRFKNDTHPDRILVVRTENARPVRTEDD